MSPPRRLLVMRHAHAEAPSVRKSDIHRSLTEGGRSEAGHRGATVRDFAPDLVLCSSAARATETMEALDLGDTPVQIESGIYQAGPDDLCSRLTQVDPDVQTVLVIGHLPTVGHLVHLLVEDASMMIGFAPAALAVLALSGSWFELVPHRAHLVSFHG